MPLLAVDIMIFVPYITVVTSIVFGIIFLVNGFIVRLLLIWFKTSFFFPVAHLVYVASNLFRHEKTNIFSLPYRYREQ